MTLQQIENPFFYVLFYIKNVKMLNCEREKNYLLKHRFFNIQSCENTKLRKPNTVKILNMKIQNGEITKVFKY